MSYPPSDIKSMSVMCFQQWVLHPIAPRLPPLTLSPSCLIRQCLIKLFLSLENTVGGWALEAQLTMGIFGPAHIVLSKALQRSPQSVQVANARH